MVCSGSSGDIRSAINNLQFSSVPGLEKIFTNNHNADVPFIPIHCKELWCFSDYPQHKEVLRGNHLLKSKVKAVSRSTLRKKSKPKNGQEGQPPVGMKDTCLFLFRALGKILHCKSELVVIFLYCILSFIFHIILYEQSKHAITVCVTVRHTQLLLIVIFNTDNSEMLEKDAWK